MPDISSLPLRGTKLEHVISLQSYKIIVHSKQRASSELCAGHQVGGSGALAAVGGLVLSGQAGVHDRPPRLAGVCEGGRRPPGLDDQGQQSHRYDCCYSKRYDGLAGRTAMGAQAELHGAM